MSAFAEMLRYDFVWRALVVGAIVSLSAASLGSILVLKRYSMIGHALSDVGFAALSMALALGWPPIAVSMPVVVGASFAIMGISQNKRISGDVVIGMIATGSLSFGVIVTALTNGFNIDVSNYMFGSILTTTQQDVAISLALGVLVLGLFMVFYNRLFLITCDEDFAKASGLHVTFYQLLIAFLTAVTVVIGMRMMGTLLMSSFIIFPAVICRPFAKSFRALVIAAASVSLACFLLGLFASFWFNLPSGASVVAVNVLVLAISRIFARQRHSVV